MLRLQWQRPGRINKATTKTSDRPVFPFRLPGCPGFQASKLGHASVVIHGYLANYAAKGAYARGVIWSIARARLLLDDDSA
jgi:hypothetical protein